MEKSTIIKKVNIEKILKVIINTNDIVGVKLVDDPIQRIAAGFYPKCNIITITKSDDRFGKHYVSFIDDDYSYDTVDYGGNSNTCCSKLTWKRRDMVINYLATHGISIVR